MIPTSSEAAALKRKLIVGLLLINGIAVAWQVQNLLEIRRALEVKTQVATRNMALALDQSITDSVNRIDVGLLACIDFMEDQLRSRRTMRAEEVNATLRKQQSRLPELQGIRATDASGMVRYGPNVDAASMASWAVRDFFVQLKDNPHAGLVVTNPMIGKVSHQWVVAFGRRYNHPDGSFAGVIAAAVPVEYLERLLSSMDVGEHGIAVLRDTNLAMIARYPRANGANSEIGAKTFSTELASAIASGQQVVTYHAVNTSDGVERINTYRRLSTVPFHLLAGNGAQDYLREFSSEVWMDVAQLLLLLLLSSLGAMVLWRAFKNTFELSERNHALLRGSSDGVHIIDDSGYLVEASDSFFEVLGYTREEGIYLNASDWNAEMSAAELRQKWADLLHCGKTTYLTRYRRKDGSEFTVEVSVQPLHMSGRRLLFKASRDVTERVAAQRQLQELNANLESRVQQRTQELQLALRAAECASESKSAFLANTSHEIRTPMNSVLGMTHLALKHAADPKQRDYLQQIQGAGTHLMRIIDDILDYSKMDAGKMELNLADFDLKAMLHRVMDLMATHALDKQLEMRLETDPDLPTMLVGDHVRIEQVLLNFLSNAIKFTHRGSVVLRVQQQQATGHSCALSFAVVDSGIGLTQEQSSRLFQTFEQADKSITRKFGGTGLGLAICRQLAQLMEGTVGVQSVPGQGSTFWFRATFPTGSGVAPATPFFAVPEQSLVDMRCLQGRSILVVDDSEFNLAVAMGLLEDVGALVSTAENGAAALEILQDRPMDCVLMDVQMPVMDGLEATRRIRADPRLAQHIVIALTANASGADVERCLHAGMNDAIRKPVVPESFYQTLCQWLAPDEVMAWDADALARLAGGKPAAAARLREKYLDTARLDVAGLHHALETQDWKHAAALGHKLKSSSRTVGAMRLGALCQTLEVHGNAGDACACRTSVAQIVQAFSRMEAHSLKAAQSKPGIELPAS